MNRSLSLVSLALLAICGSAIAAPIRGHYLETRTCQVYTGPCFANAEVGIAGRDAIMAWQIKSGELDSQDLAGLKVVVVVRAEKTLGFDGLNKVGELKAVVLLDERASGPQREALLKFAKQHAGPAGSSVVRVQSLPIAMKLDVVQLRGEVTAGKEVALKTRQARRGDCICSNESAYYPPLAQVENFVPGVTLEGRFDGRGLGTRWSTPGDRSAYMGTFAY